jgi:hypothetical protein
MTYSIFAIPTAVKQSMAQVNGKWHPINIKVGPEGVKDYVKIDGYNVELRYTEAQMVHKTGRA